MPGIIGSYGHDNLLSNDINHCSITFQKDTHASFLSFGYLKNCNKTSGVPLVYNGRVTNFKQLSDSLLSNGIKACSSEDILAALFRFYGKEMFSKLEGSYSVAVYDEQSSKLFIARDRPGIEPVYYYLNDKTFLFSTKLFAFKDLSSFKKEIDPASLAMFFKYRFIPSPYSIFKNTFKLEAGSYLELDLNTMSLSVHKYWDINDHYSKPLSTLTEKEVETETERLLIQAVNDASGIRNVPGVLLTGGYDSSAVAAILQANREYKVKTFTVGMEDAGFSEAPFAAKVAKSMGTDHHEIHYTSNDLKDLFTSYGEIYDEPLGDAVSIPVLAFCKYAGQQVTSVLSGEGADEIFGGYRYHYNNISSYKRFTSLPYAVKRSAYHTAKMVAALRVSSSLSAKLEKLDTLSQLKDIHQACRIRVEPSYFNENEIVSLIGDHQKYRTYYDDTDLKQNDLMNMILALDSRSVVPDKNLPLIRDAAGSFGLSIREPFTDHKLGEFLASVPSKYKYKKNIPKYILKNIIHRYIPEDVMKRNGPPLSLPLGRWMNGFLKEFVLYYLSEEILSKDPYLNKTVVLDMVKGFYSGSGISPDKIFLLLAFSMWYNKWFKE